MPAISYCDGEDVKTILGLYMVSFTVRISWACDATGPNSANDIAATMVRLIYLNLSFITVVNLFARFTVTALTRLEVGYRFDKIFLGEIGPIF